MKIRKFIDTMSLSSIAVILGIPSIFGSHKAQIPMAL